jgi:hypothetical protein
VEHLLAYIDPGSGSLIIQALIATIVAIPFLFRQQFARASRALRRRPETTDRANDITGSGQEEVP